ncbi:MAG TPA: hypothetical protein VFT67_03605 [Jatrophihabitantaceae bacterium]|nr:hypothetical protein [Jatrophihabitantaceae bacterium]
MTGVVDAIAFRHEDLDAERVDRLHAGGNRLLGNGARPGVRPVTVSQTDHYAEHGEHHDRCGNGRDPMR